MPKILIIEPSRGIRNTLVERLEYEGYTVLAFETSDEARAARDGFGPDVVLSDSCYECTKTLTVPLIIIAADSSIENAVESVRAGAFDFITKPVDMNRLLGSIKKAIGADRAPDEMQHDRMQPRTITKKQGSGIQEIIGKSEKIVAVKNYIDRVAPSDARVLVTGENGTGKELVARWLHEKSRRSGAPFVEINCAAIPSELIESELFGHEKGAFTSAIKQRKGKFEQASGGTLFMDEIGDMSLSAQAKVLRALQEGRVTRVGSDHDIEVDVRVVAATNKNLKDEIQKGNFREDLYHRLSVIIIHIPPLRERVGDIPMLIEHFADTICRAHGITRKKVSAESVDLLKTLPWSGNIRELSNVVERLIILASDDITAQDVHDYVGELM